MDITDEETDRIATAHQQKQEAEQAAWEGRDDPIMDAVAFREFIDVNMKHNPAEAKIVRRVYQAMKDAGNPIVSVWDGERDTKVTTLREVFDIVFNLDQAHLYAKSGAWIFIVLGNEWDALSDYTVSIEEIVAPVNEWIASKW